jgi:hypothetical protein
MMLATIAVSCAAGADRAKLSGTVRNVTCAGPCAAPPPNPPVYTGAGLTVRVRSLRSNDIVATRHPSDGRFTVRLVPGRYRVTADVAGSCWRGSSRRVRLDGEHEHVRLSVENACVV